MGLHSNPSVKMEQKMTFNFVHPNVNMVCPSTLEAVNNHFVANTDIELVHGTPEKTYEVTWKWNKVNAKLSEMFRGQYLYDVDVRDLYTMIEEMDLHKQWSEMNAKVRAQLDEISAKVE